MLAKMASVGSQGTQFWWLPWVAWHLGGVAMPAAAHMTSAHNLRYAYASAGHDAPEALFAVGDNCQSALC